MQRSASLQYEGFAFLSTSAPSHKQQRLMLAVMVTTLFTEEFAPTLLCGIPFLAVILLIYFLRFRQKAAVSTDAPKPLPLQR